MSLWSEIEVPLEPEEYFIKKLSVPSYYSGPTIIEYALVPTLQRLVERAGVVWHIEHQKNAFPRLIIESPRRNERHLVRQLRRFNAILTCEPQDGEKIVKYLEANGTGQCQPGGLVRDGSRGLIYLTDLEDAALVRMKFNSVLLVDCAEKANTTA